MRKVQCAECGKRYDFDEDDFCPKCGAFNPPEREAAPAGQARIHGPALEETPKSWTERVRASAERRGPRTERRQARPRPRRTITSVIWRVLLLIIALQILTALMGLFFRL